MKYTKTLTAILAILLSLAILSGCDAGNGKQSENTNNTTSENKKVSVGSVDIEVLSCAFDNEVMGVDEEFSSYGFTKIDGKVYVNLALKITNNGAKAITKDDISGYFEYDELRYDLQYELAAVAPTDNHDESIQPGCVGVINMLSRVDEAATSEELTVKFTVDGKEFEEKVAPIDTRDALSKKTEVRVGDTFDANGLYVVEVISCAETKYLQTTNFEESQQYEALGDKKFVDLILKVKNNTDVDLKEIKSYILIDDEGTYASDEIEINGNTDFEDLDRSPLKAGQEEYIHIYATVENSVNTDGLAIRFNLAGNCYYCRVQ